MKLLIRLISANDLKGSVQIGALLLLQKKRSVCAAEQTGCTGDHFKTISGLSAAAMRRLASETLACGLVCGFYDGDGSCDWGSVTVVTIVTIVTVFLIPTPVSF